MSSAIFEPKAIKAILKRVLSSRENSGTKKSENKPLVDWKKDWTDEAIKKRVEGWQKSVTTSSLDQLEFAAHVLEYVKILQTAALGKKSGTTGTVSSISSPDASVVSY